LNFHAANSDAWLVNVFLGLFGFFALADCLRGLAFRRWLRLSQELSHTVTGKVIRTMGWNLRRDFRITFTTLVGKKIFADAGYGLPLYSTLGLKKGDDVTVTYCENNPHLFYIASLKSDALFEAHRKVILGPIWVALITGFLAYFNFILY
jgi:hypothetical protein